MTKIFKQMLSKNLVLRMMITLVIGGLFVGATTLWAQDNCMNDVWNDGASNNKGDLVCTAKEVFIDENADGSKIIDAVVVGDDGCRYPGDTATVNIVADLHFNADRYDVGIYSAVDGGNGLRGQCAVDVQPTGPAPATNVDGDICGDVYASGGVTFHDFAFQTMTLTCEDQDEDGFLDFSTCFSWRTAGNNEVCTGADDIFPGTKSKCFCERVNINVPVPKASLGVKKTASPASVQEPGADVTFTIEVTNNGIDPNNWATIDSLVDSVYGDIGGICLDANGDSLIGQSVPGNGGVLSCSFTKFVAGNAKDTHHNTVVVGSTDDRGNAVPGEASANVPLTGASPVITVQKSVSVDGNAPFSDSVQITEGSGPVAFKVVVTNDSVGSDPVTITSLKDDMHGDLNGQGTCSFAPVDGLTIAPGASYACTFSATVTVPVNASEVDTVTALGHDDDGVDVNASDTATVTVVDVPGKISLIKVASPTSVDEPGGVVTFTVTVTNDSVWDDVTINSLTDSIYGDLNDMTDESGTAKPQLSTTCEISQLIPPHGSYTCSFTAMVSGNAGYSEPDTATASGQDDDDQPVTASASAMVNVQNVNPSAVLTKIVAQAVVTYKVSVQNTSNSADPLTLTDLLDVPYGDLLDSANPEVSNNTCLDLANTVIQPGAQVTCTFDAVVVGSPNSETTVTDTVTGTAVDDEKNTITRSDGAQVTLSPTPAP